MMYIFVVVIIVTIKKPKIFGVYKEKENNGFPSEYHACATSLRQGTPLLFGCAASSPWQFGISL